MKNMLSSLENYLNTKNKEYDKNAQYNSHNKG